MSTRILRRTVHKRTARRFLAAVTGVVLAGAGLGWAGEARADGIDWAICSTLDDYPTQGGVFGVGLGLMERGYTAYEAGQKIAAAVVSYCPEHLPELQAFVNSAGQGRTAA